MSAPPETDEPGHLTSPEKVSTSGYGLPVYILIVGLLIITAYFAYELIFRRTKGVAAGGPRFIIAGPSGSGKTSLFTLLRYGKKSTTLPSVEQNLTAKFRLPNLPDTAKPFVLIDTPGHQKLRHGMFSALQTAQAARTVLGVLYVVDASAMSRPERLREAAEYMYDILRITERVQGGTDVLVAANKSELFTAVPAKRLRTLLETELYKIRESRAKSVSKVAAGGEKDDEDDDNEDVVGGSGWIGKRGEKGSFKLEDLETEVTVIDGSVDNGKIDAWIGWMEERAVN
ncbi:signal recognition particle receptor beta subunit-domain-containing protein [Lipomyces tetrasporus]|uniref:Signal recognition particle receptor subunit beta n=1 Tax=Lipomyces tetrasporus TaxID=54092 RepID=A0AAD7VQW4_9ASCO|nr:signal recognition particle receptor beta subunit-domain-containing protein [Lipomyces tetrasporus]KAJ8099337.1 signal recognition particle receptor beta subunit-domain-containing protein [Lipomyces tetrasporus]